MKQEFNASVAGGVAGGDIVHREIHRQTNIHIATNNGQVVSGDIHNHGPVHLHLAAETQPKIKVVIQPGPECIDEAQKTHLKALVAEVIRLEGLLKRVPRTFGSVWVAVNAKCKASSYHLITQDSFPKAEKFLREWIGRLSSGKSAPAKDGNWRNRKFSYIFTNVKQLDADAALRSYLQARHQTDSMKGLSDADLEAIYRLVAGWKKVGHPPRQAIA